MAAPKKWHVYAAKHPTNFDGTPFSGLPQNRNHGWFWLKQRGNISLYIRVQGLDNARWVARTLTMCEPVEALRTRLRRRVKQ